MSNIKNIVIGVLLVLILGVGGYAITRSPTPSQSAGAVASPDIPFPWFSFGGVRQWAGHTDSLGQATTTICTIQAPNATSSLTFASLRLDISSTSASIVDFAKSSNTGATTTKIGTTYNIGADAQVAIVASTTGSVAGDATIFAPNQYFVVNMKGGATNVFSPTGSCQAVWTQL